MKTLPTILILFAPCCLAQNYPALSVYAALLWIAVCPAMAARRGARLSRREIKSKTRFGLARRRRRRRRLPKLWSTASPIGVAVDSKGNLFIADECNNQICKVDPTTA
jgi:NHL repeat